MDDKAYKDWVVRTLTALGDDMTEVRVTLATNTTELSEHMRRTDLLEKRVDGIWLRVLSIVGGIVGIGAGVARIFGHG